MDSFDSGPLHFPVVDEGSGPPVVLLHGFPQDSRSWDDVAPLLHRAGLRTLRFDQRGYPATARPRRTQDYRVPHLVDDVLALLDAAGLERAHVVGHDLGGLVAWAMASAHPERVETMTVLSTPHPAAFLRALYSSRQPLLSWYMAAFQVPGVAERVIGGPGGAQRLRTVLRPMHTPAVAVDRAVELMADRDRARAMLQWYRALPRSLGGETTGSCRVPTTYVWSTRDEALSRKAAEETGRHVEAPYLFEVLDDRSHWLPEEVPDVVADLVQQRVAGG